MGRNILRLSYLFAKNPVCQNLRKLTITGTRISSNYCQSTNIKFLKDVEKTNKKKMKPSTSNILNVDKSVSDENASGKILKDVNFQNVKLSNEENITNKTRKLPESFSEMLNKFYEAREFRPFGPTLSTKDSGFSREKDTILNFLEREGNFLNVKSTDIDLIKEHKQKCRVESFNLSLASYISACMYSGFHEVAYETFNYYRNLKMVNSEGLNLIPFNEVLRGIANQGDLKKMKEVLISLGESSLKPDCNTIAYCLTCLGRNENTQSVIDDTKNVLELMDQNKITLDEIFGNATFPGDSFHHCLLAVERVIPDARDKLETINPTTDYVLKESSYNNELVNNLNKSLFTNQVGSPAEGALPSDKLKEMIQTQIDNELKGVIEIPKLNAEKSTSDNEKAKSLWNDWTEEWHKDLHEALNKYRAFMSKTFLDPDLSHLSYFPYFCVLNNEDIIDVILKEIKIISKRPADWYSNGQYARFIGENFYDCFLKRYKEKQQSLLRNVYENYCYSTLYPSNNDASHIPRMEWNIIVAKENHSTNWNDIPLEWPYTVKTTVGHMLYNFIFDNIKIWDHGSSPKHSFPAFNKSYESNHHAFRPSFLLNKVFKSSRGNVFFANVNKMPMLSPPVPWTNVNNGGYFIKKSKLVNNSFDDERVFKLMQEKGMQKFYPMLDTLNFQGVVPWKVNCDLLDTITKIFKNNGWAEVGICPSPKLLPNAPQILENMTTQEEEEALQYRDQLKKVWTIWIETEKNLSVLNYFRDKVFWFPYSFDFRSRIYPICSHLNHVEYPDLIRSTLCFAKGKKLGKDGLYWLKLHIVNLTGMKKRCSIEDRLKFVDEIMDEIFDSAKNPLNGNKWWAKCDEPFQTLAACKELVAALESESPEEYVSHLPIHQDGSCNALQHFAALARDEDEAGYVNLSPSNTPQDFYLHIIKLMEAKRQEDASNGVEIAQQLEGKITRKALKQSILVKIYGGGKGSSYRAILRSQKELNDFPEKKRQEALEYLDSNSYNIFNEQFQSFPKIRNWLRKISRGISQRCFKCIEFETPLGFPVIQSSTVERRSVERPKEVIAPYDLHSSLLPDIMKQRRSFSPNFIHSLEASHMLLTSLYCQDAGITFSSIHDCFWTHAATVPVMNKICREQFISLHSQPILENFAKSMIEKYSAHPNYDDFYTQVSENDDTPVSLQVLLNKVPEKGDLNLNEILRSDFFFS